MERMRGRPRSTRTRRSGRALLGTVAVALVTVCCSGDDTVKPPDEFCEAAASFDEKVSTATPEEQIELVTEMVETAPDEIVHEARVFLDSLNAAADGDETVVDDPDVEKSVDELNRFASRGCELLGGSSPYG